MSEATNEPGTHAGNDAAQELSELAAALAASAQKGPLLYSTYHRQLLARTAAWLAAGRAPALLIEGVQPVAHAWWWAMQHSYRAATHAAPCRPLQGYIHASRDALGQAAIDGYFSQRVHCCSCGQRWRVENVGICVLCGRYWCCECLPAPVAQRFCGCGGEVVI